MRTDGSGLQGMATPPWFNRALNSQKSEVTIVIRVHSSDPKDSVALVQFMYYEATYAMPNRLAEKVTNAAQGPRILNQE